MANLSTVPSHDIHDDTLAPPRRSESPEPSISPSYALDAVPQLTRSASTPSDSSFSTLSNRSRQSRASDGGLPVIKRRGYMRPQGTSFADSARNRDSVMSLGSIAHMQYYFARTGLLDGKGGQLAKEGQQRKKSSTEKENADPSAPSISTDELTINNFMMHSDGQSNYAISDSGLDHSVVESPSEMNEGSDYWPNSSDPIMLPPTVSTYKEKPPYIEPLPDMISLRRELKEALQNGCKVLEECQKQQEESSKNGDPPENNGFYEIQGLHVLDIITLAIRAAKNYYTAHTNPQKLYAIRSERVVRSDLYQVLDTLKRMASRNFRGGLRLTELAEIITWIESIDKLIKQEDLQEQQEAAERESWTWREGDWTGKEREREWLFLKSFDADEPTLPRWPESTDTAAFPTDFLRTLQDGQRLIKLHNALLGRSKRKFDEIKSWHSDVAKPYRMADNLRYWVKAAELRWEIKIFLPVLDVVNDKDAEAWQQFDQAIFAWAQGVRAELTEEWRQELRAYSTRRPPELKFEVLDENPEEEKKQEAESMNDTHVKNGSTVDAVAEKKENEEEAAQVALPEEQQSPEETPQEALSINTQPVSDLATAHSEPQSAQEEQIHDTPLEEIPATAEAEPLAEQKHVDTHIQVEASTELDVKDPVANETVQIEAI